MQLEHICNQVKDKNEVAIIDYIITTQKNIITLQDVTQLYLQVKQYFQIYLQLTCNL